MRGKEDHYCDQDQDHNSEVKKKRGEGQLVQQFKQGIILDFVCFGSLLLECSCFRLTEAYS